MKIFKTLLALSMFLIISGCASIAGDNTRNVNVTSMPSGAGIYVDNQQYGVTPKVITLPSMIYGGKVVTVKKAGFSDQSRVINTAFQPVSLFDILFWPTFIVDAMTGDLVKIDPASRNIHMNLAH